MKRRAIPTRLQAPPSGEGPVSRGRGRCLQKEIAPFKFAPGRSLVFLLAGGLALALPGCATVDRHEEEGALPEVTLSETPPAVQAAIVSAAAGARIQTISPGQQLEHKVFRTFIDAPGGPRLVAVNEQGAIIEDAVVVPFSELPLAVQTAARTATDGRLLLCRKSSSHSPPTYLIDYLIGDEEPVYAIIQADGFIRAVIGYLEEDAD